MYEKQNKIKLHDGDTDGHEAWGVLCEYGSIVADRISAHTNHNVVWDPCRTYIHTYIHT